MARKITINTEHNAKGLTSIAQTALPITRQLLGANGFMQAELLSSWDSIVGTEIAQYSLPQKLVFTPNMRSDGCLTIAVPAGAFAMEIKQNEAKIIAQINAFFGYQAISKIKILQNDNPENFSIGKKPIDKVKKTVVSADEESYITELVKNIERPELREAIENLGRAVYADNNHQE
ncbi:MAG: DUF721 domain-containing protein [Alphaproteobacteria bacterium]|nr:DUF721 domain-containing protein [Alphaproteobacteria bacterium]